MKRGQEVLLQYCFTCRSWYSVTNSFEPNKSFDDYAAIFISVVELASPRVTKISTTMSHPSLIGLFTCCK